MDSVLVRCWSLGFGWFVGFGDLSVCGAVVLLCSVILWVELSDEWHNSTAF